ncbi:Vps16, N-terminal region-domain-containing protein [Dichomitus squalens]|uniref:Vps16, N-terminal region-domain-containing protein n=1 Tax=Dichomitus squalens TaxID=114155 RepID=A0A4Q9PZL3_9APHY|nr:Vps16, N-terminal region-domain-containing protein [Dichomitus squalens]TBU60109.1 Vps16, N-terminal region-domain-containing protein [Dichomitus squalens]
MYDLQGEYSLGSEAGERRIIDAQIPEHALSLALLTFSALLWVVLTDFGRSLAGFDTSAMADPSGYVHQSEWCGNDAVLVGLFGYTSSNHPPYILLLWVDHAVTLDGIRIIGPDTCDFVQKCPVPSSVSVFRPGSTSPSENFSRPSPKADESIRSIRPELAAAVDECIDAAARESEPFWQRRLLNHRACVKILRSKPQTTGTGKNADLESGDEALSRVIVERVRPDSEAYVRQGRAAAQKFFSEDKDS